VRSKADSNQLNLPHCTITEKNNDKIESPEGHKLIMLVTSVSDQLTKEVRVKWELKVPTVTAVLIGEGFSFQYVLHSVHNVQKLLIMACCKLIYRVTLLYFTLGEKCRYILSANKWPYWTLKWSNIHDCFWNDTQLSVECELEYGRSVSYCSDASEGVEMQAYGLQAPKPSSESPATEVVSFISA